MKTAERRKSKGGEFGVNVGASVPPAAFYEIEGLAKAFGITKSAVVRELVLLGLAEYHRRGKLPTQTANSTGEQLSSQSSDTQRSN